MARPGTSSQGIQASAGTQDGGLLARHAFLVAYLRKVLF